MSNIFFSTLLSANLFFGNLLPIQKEQPIIQPKPVLVAYENVTAKSTPPKPNIQPSTSSIEKQILNILNRPDIQEKFKGPKGEKGEAGTIISQNNFNPDFVGIQPTYMMGGAIGPDVGTIFSSTMLSAESFSANSADIEEITSSGSLTVAGDAELQGNTSIATGSIVSLKVGTLTSDSGAYLSDGGDWVNASSKELKENIILANPDELLLKINALPIYTWNYKSQNASTTHIGPLAEDFYNAFSVGGEKGKKSISSIDPAGISLAGIQALYKKITELENKIDQLSKNQTINTTLENIPTTFTEPTPSTTPILIETEKIEATSTPESIENILVENNAIVEKENPEILPQTEILPEN
jgi:hypothetical protein